MKQPDNTLLHAFADGQLEAAEHTNVAQWLATHPETAAEVAGWQAQSAAMHGAYDPTLDEPVPARLLTAARGGAPASNGSRWGMAAAIGWLAIGLVGGFIAGRNTDTAPTTAAQIPLARQAAVAHAVYAPEVRHPVEVGADQRDHLLGWLSKRLGHPIVAPALEPLGYQLVGGRLLSGESGPGALLMYEDASGERLTLFVSADTDENATAFRFAEHDKVNVFYWVDAGYGYALSGTLPRERLLTVATSVYRALNP
ncbi:anti-sigma factor family protein [Denitromonas halophila]|uniref:Anti-sigma factor n=1 Tax=Denitromonas halophila TaxID=1629404 RepID=A0A557QWA5_9RHOO|nr:anti-sigma factor [Denitromonas halophila]TVO57190.1 anti-sigma factor [Denitromonas halophila]